MRTSAIRYNRILLMIALLLSAATVSAQTLTESVRLGGRAGWDALTEFENSYLVDGWQGGHDLVLRDWGATVDATTDLLVPFDTGAADVTGRYRVSSDETRRSTVTRRFGAAAAGFDGTATVTYRPGGDALLAPDTQPGAFTIDMYLYPLRITEGATILRWRGALINAGLPILQDLRFEIRDNRLVWDLENLIVRAAADGTRRFSGTRLAARRGLVPERWSHHQLRYDARIGQLSYRVDGRAEAIVYLTDTGTERGDPAGVYFGADTGEGLVIGRDYHGFLDELRITRDADRSPRPVSYSPEVGRAVTDPIHLGPTGARVDAVLVQTDQPGRTEVRTWYRTADIIVARSASEALPAEWRRVPADGILPPEAWGRYIQLRFDLLPDAAGQRSPRVQSAEIRYRPELPPPVPKGFSGTGVAGGVELHWDPVRIDDVAGYRVYVGERPGRYLGTPGVRSPIDVGSATSTTIEGLQPDRAYVFTIESYDRYGETSGLAREIQIRAGGGQE